MSLNVQGLLDRLVSHAASLGHFEKVNTHEPKSAPGLGLTAGIWAQSIRPVPRASGLAATSALVIFTLRIYTPMLTEPQDAIDPNVIAAVDALLQAYTGDFTLGGTVMQVDLLGHHGTPLSVGAGYLSQDHRLYRVMDVTVPLVVTDAWTQEA